MNNKPPPSELLDEFGRDPDDTGVFVIRKFTAVFDVDEDRVRLETIDRDSMTQVIYVTRRLLDQLVPVLAENLVKTGTSGPSNSLVQEFAQACVRNNRPHMAGQAPVCTRRDAPKWLAKALRVSARDGGLLLTFRDNKQRAAQMPLMWEDIRSLLDILLVVYQRGSWTTSVFPDWIRPKSPQAQSHRMN
ncbi:MAG: hypothetical protein NXI27_29905 [Alphaproteobacteria bacterium]|nr:hypothetical protein [Alphaproteobacteria bacterium]